MLSLKEIQKIVANYNTKKIKIGMIASHSALDICDGAIEEGFNTIAIAEKGREKTYANYFKAKRIKGRLIKGIVDEIILVDKFKEIMEEKMQDKLRKENVIFIPNRSFTSYINIKEIEDNFKVPLFGSRNLLRTEEREEKENYYELLKKANLPYPEKINPKDINCLTIVKLHHAKKKLERGFFTASSFKEYKEKSSLLIKQGIITEDELQNARIERYIIGPVFNLDFFYSPLQKELELIGVDWRFESSLDGLVRLPAIQQLSLNEEQKYPEYTVCGHTSATLRESLLENAFELGEKYVKATKKYYEYGIIGAFCLQTCVDKDLKFYIYDVAPRIGGGTNVHLSVGHPYGNSLWRRQMSSGRRTAMEIKIAIEEDRLEEVVS